ncbi:MAG: transcriptional initiation protein Tat, partial [Hyphomonadaceae bacterium]
MSTRSNSFADLACESLSRRGFLTATAVLPSLSLMASEAQAAPAGFKAVAENRLDTVVVPEGYV